MRRGRSSSAPPPAAIDPTCAIPAGNADRITTYTLTNNPIVFNSTTVIDTTQPGGSGGNAVDGPAGTAWNILNRGKLIGAANGMSLQSGTFFIESVISNDVTGLINGDSSGIVLALVLAPTITNAGSINGTTESGVDEFFGNLTNQSSGKITGGKYGVYFRSGGFLSNAFGGYIGGGTHGFVTHDGATVVNPGTIKGGQDGIYATSGDSGAPTTVTNPGTVIGVGRHGINLLTGGAVTIPTGGVVTGAAYGIRINDGGTVVSDSRITGQNGIAVKFTGGNYFFGLNSLTLQSGSVMSGDAVGSDVAGTTNALILQGTNSDNNNFFNFTSLDVRADATGSWVVNGSTVSVETAKVSSGTFVVGDANHTNANLGVSVGGLTVMQNAVLGGHGTITGNVVVQDGGIVHPSAVTVADNAVGPTALLRVTGNMTFAGPNSVFRVNANSDGTNDRVDVTGTASLAGSVDARAGGSFQPTVGLRYVILHSNAGNSNSNGLNNTEFGSVKTNLAFLMPTLTYENNDNDVVLTLVCNGSAICQAATPPPTPTPTTHAHSNTDTHSDTNAHSDADTHSDANTHSAANRVGHAEPGGCRDRPWRRRAGSHRHGRGRSNRRRRPAGVRCIVRRNIRKPALCAGGRLPPPRCPCAAAPGLLS